MRFVSTLGNYQRGEGEEGERKADESGTYPSTAQR
ncbi:hypothetical protein IEO21_11004 [Rhodonia placenta]|uniref:Uncharacterized protein n=1 Tax=Rhodonia placenta TaxID=104341 RepID=A0A8H7TVQ9_9APHY|nr:hypothetical protein IEO21_11004 [Postia placenta]